MLRTVDVGRTTSIPEEQARYQAAMRKYQREKGPPLHIEGLQPFILKPDASRAFGRHARRENILAARVVGELVRSSLGPKGMKKMLVNNDGLIWVTSDGATLLSKMDFQHPVAKLMVEVAQAVHREVGDGATSTVLLASELLKRSDDMVQQGLHPTVISEGYIKAGKEALRICRKIATSVNPTDTSVLRNVASTALCGRMNDKNIAHSSTVATDAALSAMHRVRTKYDLDLSDVNVEKKVGGSLAEVRLVDGFAFCRELAHPAMPRTTQDAKVAVLQGQLKLDKRGRTPYEHVFTIQHVDDAKRLTDGRLRVLQEMVGRLVNVGANVVVLEKGIDATVADILARHGVMAIRRVVIEDLERIAKATGARVVSHVEDLSADDLGSAKTVAVRKVGGDDWTFIEGCVNPKCVTILIRGATERLTDEAERSLIGAVATLRSIMQRPLIVAGGGAVEIELAAQLRRWGERIAGRRQLPILNFAE
ncbi:MAG: thermosome subunit alpha, partial [Candidatus Bathyarchaeia archaeon]